MSKTRSNRPCWGEEARRNQCNHRRTGTHLWAWFRSSAFRNGDTLLSSSL